MVLVFVCFFRQKTAYEMRISDWSSDVCASDLTYYVAGRRFIEPPSRYGVLLDRIMDGLHIEHGQEALVPLAGIRIPFSVRSESRSSVRVSILGGRMGDRYRLLVDPSGFSIQIGRASCRERVCQSV